MRQMTPTELRDYLGADQPAPLLLDVREPWEYRIAHIEGSELIPMRQVQGHLHELDPGRPTVVICHHGVRSLQVAYFLKHHGFSDVINLAGGINAWSREVDTAVPLY